MYYEALKSTLRFIAQLNEFTLLFNIWIVSPLAHSKGQTRSSIVGSTLRSIGYAVSEPLYTLLLAHLPIDPALSLLMATIIHCFQFYWLWIMLDCVANLRLRNARTRDHEAQSGRDLVAEGKLDAEDRHLASSTENIDWKILYPFAFSFIQTAAASNAALLLAAQTAEITELNSHTVHVILLAADLFYFVLSRLADCYLARAMGLPLYFGQNRALKMVIPQVANLLLIVLLRAGARWSAGMEAFAGALGNDTLGVEKFVGLAGFLDWLGHAPRWLSPFLLLLSPCLMYLSGRFSAKSRVE
jgi:hypothetical protein